ncbi:hypothetical protein [Streptomyces fructofermentans]|uniref:hypothetical protein n=1 Tax=Streptomyces fructofermentans TaxID=152141 RepID=UPI004032AB69
MERMKELEILVGRQATRSVIEGCPYLLDWLPAPRIPVPDTPGERARAFQLLLREIVDQAQDAFNANPQDPVARSTLAVGALFGLVTWGPKETPDQYAPSARSLESRQALAGDWMDPPVAGNTVRRRKYKTRLLAEFRHTLYDHAAPAPSTSSAQASSASRDRAVGESADQPQRDAAAVNGTHLRMPRTARTRAVLAAVIAVAVGVAAVVAWQFRPPADSDDDPVSVDDVARVEQAGSFVLPQRLDLGPGRLDEINHDKFWQGGAGHKATFSSWFAEHKAVWAEDSAINVTLSGASDKTVRITGIDLEKHDCRSPAGGGTLFYAPVGGSGEDENIGLLFDMDAPQPTAQDEDGQDYFARRTITLKPGEAETLSLFVRTRRQNCAYSYRLRVVVPGDSKPVWVTIQQDFRLTALATGADPTHPYSPYRALYVGGAASPAQGAFVRADPVVYNNDPATLMEP